PVAEPAAIADGIAKRYGGDAAGTRRAPARVIADGVVLLEDANLHDAATDRDDRLRVNRRAVSASDAVEKDSRSSELIRRRRTMLDGGGVVGVQKLGTKRKLRDRAHKAFLLLLARSVGKLGGMKVRARSLRRLRGGEIKDGHDIAPGHARAIHSCVDGEVPRIHAVNPAFDGGAVAEHGAKMESASGVELLRQQRI